MSLRAAYTVWAPVYDAAVDAATRGMRRQSLAALAVAPGDSVLLVGIGTGLDLPWLPPGPRYVGIDLTPAMLERARRRADRAGCELELRVADAAAVPYADRSFDAVVMHLILAVVPDPAASLREAARVLRPGGEIVILDKFLRPGQRAPLRRLAAPLMRRIATRTDVVFEDCLAAVDGLEVVTDSPVGGRRLVPQDSAPPGAIRPIAEQ